MGSSAADASGPVACGSEAGSAEAGFTFRVRVSGTPEDTGAGSKSQAACRRAGSPNSWPRDWVLCRTKQDLASRDLGCEAGCQKGDIG